MKLLIPTKVRWLREVSDDPLAQYSKRQRRALRSILHEDTQTTVSYEFLPLDQTTVDWFTLKYNKLIGTKENAVLHNITNTTINNPAGGKYWILTINEGSENVGGIIFSERTDRINMAYKALNHRWQHTQHDAGPSLYADYIMSEKAKELGKQYLSHGKDRNPYGPNANIGLATFKLSVGCKAYYPTEEKLTEIETEALDQDSFILHAPETGTELIKNATLLCTPESEEKLSRLTKYPNQIEVKIEYR
jgi:hypothetical protein